MFIDFFYKLREFGVNITPTAFLSLHRAILKNLIFSLNDFYIISRSILVKDEKYFDIFDQVFAYYFQGVELVNKNNFELSEDIKKTLMLWLQNSSKDIGPNNSDFEKMSPEDLVKYFIDRLKEQTDRHDGGSKWIGTAGRSPVGHSGIHPGGMRVGGVSKNMSAVKVAMERRYKDYSMSGPLSSSMISEALKKMKNLKPSGSKDQVNITDTIALTLKNAGEIEIAFDRRFRDKLKVVLLIDNGGWSMDPYVSIVQTLFNYSRSQFSEIRTYYFHNTIYETVWEDFKRYEKPFNIYDFVKFDKETRFVIVGDASMAPYELMSHNGSIYDNDNGSIPSIDCLHFFSNTFHSCVWLNPITEDAWDRTLTINIIKKIIPMFELSIDGLEKSVIHLSS